MADSYAVAKEMYPILNNYKYKIVNTPDKNSPYFLEHFAPGEPGSPTNPRPKDIDINEYGLQIFKDVRPEDIAGDVISHHLVNEDKYLSNKYKKFKESIPSETMKRRYEYHKNNLGEERDFDSWSEKTGYPELFRGYVFNQFDEETKNNLYSSEQKIILDDVKKYITKKGMNTGGVMLEDQMEMFGYTAEGAQQEADKFVGEAGNLEEDISKAASSLVPFYDSGVNIVNVAQEYMKPEQERDYDYIKSQFTEAGQSAAIEGGLLLMGGVAGKYGAKGIKALADKVKQYEIDPTAMSTFGAGAIKKKTDKEMISVFPKPERMFPEESRPKGGDYLNPATGEVLSGRNVSSAKLSISPEGKPSFKVSNDNVEEVGSVGKGKTQIKTNLFKKKAGWKWTKAPEGMEDIATLISVENRGKHFYTIETDFSKGVNLKKYPNSKTEPRLRPTVVGEIEIGPQIGNISVRGKEHPVYQSIRTFNEGGAVMDDQMQMAFMDKGGIIDDDLDVDPVSGNNVPPGSLAKEVRDDIPAMLSEGEYVVPADVLRYYGVNFFENLRGQAKQGLNTMEQNGRIGGTPMTQQDVARNMQQVSPPPQPMAPAPVQAAQGAMMQSPLRIKQQPAPQAIGNSGIPAQGYAGEDGSLVSKWSPARARYSSPMFQGTSSQEDNIAAAQELAATEEITQMRTHYNQAGESVQVSYVGTDLENMRVADGQEDLLSQYPLTEEEYLAYKKEMSKNSGGDDGGNDGGGDTTVSGGSDTSWMDGIDFGDTAAVKKWVESDDGLGMSGGARQLAGMGALGLIPQGIQANDVAKVRGIRSYYDSIGDDEMVQYLDGELKKAEKEGGLLFSALDKLGLVSGDTYAKQINDFQVINNPSLGLDDGETPNLTAEQKAAQEELVMSQTVVENDDDDDRPVFRAGTTWQQGQSPAEKEIAAEVEEYAASGKVFDPSDPSTWSGGNVGGLMTAPKPKKKSKPKKTGLAGKK